jgi:hypothetical protein
MRLFRLSLPTSADGAWPSFTLAAKFMSKKPVFAPHGKPSFGHLCVEKNGSAELDLP